MDNSISTVELYKDSLTTSSQQWSQVLPAGKYHLYQGKPGKRWMAGKRGTLKNFKDLRAEMHSKHTPKLEETGIGARETITSSSSFDPQGGGINKRNRSQQRKNSVTLICFANFLSKIGPGWEFPDGLAVRTLCFHCRGQRLDPQWGTRFHMPHDLAKKRKAGPGWNREEALISISNRVVTSI